MAHNDGVSYSKLIGWGIVIYGIMSLAWTACVVYGFGDSWISHVLQLLVLVVVLSIATRSLSRASWRDIVPYSFGWMIIVVALDAFYTVPISGLAIFSDWNVWVGYALMAVIPLIASHMRELAGSK